MLTLFRTERQRPETLVVPAAARHQLLRHHPHLTAEDVERVEAGLRQWYSAVQLADGKPLAMPSRVVDDLWHAHIACTRDYAAFCKRAFGRFLHHDPESEMDAAAAARNAGEHLRRTHDLCVRLERPAALPLLFRLDAELGVDRARRYVVTCGTDPCSARLPVTCVGHLPRVRRDRDADAPVVGDGGGGRADGHDGGSDGGGGDGGGGCGGCGS